MVSKKPRYLLIIFGALAVVALGMLFTLNAHREHERGLDALTKQLRMETKLLSEHVRLSIAAADLLLTEVEMAIRRNGLVALAGESSSWETLRRVSERMPQLGALIITDAEGVVRFSTVESLVPAGVDVSDREYFIAHRNGADRFIGKPIIGRLSGNHLIPVSNRLEDADGMFSGVIVSTLNTAYFQDVYAGESETSALRIRIYRNDGAMLSRPPVVDGESTAPSPDALQVLLPEVRHHEWSSPKGGRIIAQRRVDGYPVQVSASFEYDSFLRSLYPAWWLSSLIFLVLTACIALSVFFISRAMRKADREREVQLAIARRQREAERLSRAITSHLPSGRVLVFNDELRYIFVDGQPFDGNAVYANERIVDRTIPEIYPSNIREKFEALARNALAGIESEDEIAGASRVYKVIAAPLNNDEGQIESGLMLTQDITDLKWMQNELEARNRALQELSLTDSLLGIANRRAFDQELAREWRRAARQQQPLSLLMVDVDYFKVYNDAYGHIEGDACLQRIATVIEEAVSRPGDMVARYGGEEMAVLLPECERMGALKVAKRIHSRISEAAIPFPDSPLGGSATVSIGIAMMVPCQDLRPMRLVTVADAALYKAKEAGRNRTAMSWTMPGDEGDVQTSS